MSYSFSARSRRNLQGVHPDLVRICERALGLSSMDFTVVEGLRTIERQRALFAEGKSLTMNSRHLPQPGGYGHAVDLYPFYEGRVQVDAHFNAYRQISVAMFAAAKELGLRITWGADWNHNGRSDDERLVDSPHYQLEV